MSKIYKIKVKNKGWFKKGSSGFTGKHSDKTKLMWSKKRKGKHSSPKTEFQIKDPRISGKNSNNWKGGITPENIKIRTSIEFSLWRESVFARDNWTCQKYGIKGGKLHSHHIKNFAQFPELRLAIDNGITLSDKAHRKFHKIYGRKNNTKEQLIKFLEL